MLSKIDSIYIFFSICFAITMFIFSLNQDYIIKKINTVLENSNIKFTFREIYFVMLVIVINIIYFTGNLITSIIIDKFNFYKKLSISNKNCYYISLSLLFTVFLFLYINQTIDIEKINLSKIGTNVEEFVGRRCFSDETREKLSSLFLRKSNPECCSINKNYTTGCMCVKPVDIAFIENRGGNNI
jgi:hypothetical protein